MAPIRFRTRHLHATFVNDWRTQLDALGWITPPINFGTQPISVIDYLPDDRTELIKRNTVSITLGDYTADEDEEVGAAGGGLRSALYNVYIDCYMAEQALSIAVCDDVRDHYTDWTGPLIDQITGSPIFGTNIVVDSVYGPERPDGGGSAEAFKRYWRSMRIDAQLYFSS